MNIRHKITCVSNKYKLENQPKVGAIMELKDNPNLKATINKYKVISNDNQSNTFVELSFKKNNKEILKDITLDELHDKWQEEIQTLKIKLHRIRLKNELLFAKKVLLDMKHNTNNKSKVKKFRNISYQI